MEAIDSVGLDQFRTQQGIMVGTWKYWSEERKHFAIRILVREAYRAKYNSETLIMVYDK